MARHRGKSPKGANKPKGLSAVEQARPLFKKASEKGGVERTIITNKAGIEPRVMHDIAANKLPLTENVAKQVLAHVNN